MKDKLLEVLVKIESAANRVAGLILDLEGVENV